ncbi:hypothetical protein [Phreatobacter stygius]|uniref:hypothetical protein n=1 Tax=Phreatobacter stygius TaxID=1940610 RepID=UPI001FE60EBA|nr:hypothetical protein [Phreatobacter stygius]
MRSPIILLLVWLLLPNAAFGQQAPAASRPAGAPPIAAAPTVPRPAQIDRNGVLILIRSTILAVHHANQTGNYTVLRDMGAPGFQSVNTAARLGEIFANLRGQNFDLSGVTVLEPQLTVMPQIEANGMMRMAGVFPSVPLQVNFELLFAPVEGRWKLFGIALNLGQATPVPPAGPADPASSSPAGPQAAAGAAPAAQRPAPVPLRPPQRPPQ